MAELGISLKGIVQNLQKDNWVDVYQYELTTRTTGFSYSDFPEGIFNKQLKRKIENALKNEIKSKKANPRETIQRWWVISTNKGFSLLRLMKIIPHEISKISKIFALYEGAPLGPQDETVVNAMDSENIVQWRRSTLETFYSRMSTNNLYGLYISELFFTFEAMCRLLCISSCIDFAIRAFSPTITVQHDEIYQTLKRISSKDKDSGRIICKLCPIRKQCGTTDIYYKTALLYELFYHLRVIKDYRLEFYFDPNIESLLKMLNDELIPKSDFVICTLDKALNRLFDEYMFSPLLLENVKDTIMGMDKSE